MVAADEGRGAAAEIEVKAVVVSVGAELVSGDITDTNAAWLSRELADLGIPTVRHTCVADDEAALAETLAQSARIADLVVVTGGIGPTPDDITRQAAARATGSELVLDPGALAHIEELFAGWGRTMSRNNRVQALFPAGATVIENPRGTAAGFSVPLGMAEVIVMPGVPAEMKLMWTANVRERLAGKVSERIVSGSVDCFGRGESDITRELADLMVAGRNPAVGDTAEDAIIRIRIRATARDRDEGRRLVDADKAEIIRRLGDIVFGEDGESLQSAVVEALVASGKTLSVAESCTGGLLGAAITDIPGASRSFLEGITAYHNDVKVRLLGVPQDLIERHGAVSEEVATAMAEGVRARSGADFALSTTGIAGPSGGTPEKPVGLVWIAASSAERTVTRRLNLRGDRATVRDRTVKHALNLLRLTFLSPK